MPQKICLEYCLPTFQYLNPIRSLSNEAEDQSVARQANVRVLLLARPVKYYNSWKLYKISHQKPPKCKECKDV